MADQGRAFLPAQVREDSEVSRVLRLAYARDAVGSCAARYGLRSWEVWAGAREILRRLPEEELIRPRAIRNAIETGAMLERGRRPR